MATSSTTGESKGSCLSAWHSDAGAAACRLNTERNNTARQLSEPVQPGNVDTVSPLRAELTIY